jgi:hypothetical protein
MSEYTVSDWNELHKNLFESSWKDRIGRFRSPYVFRGSSSQKDLRTGLSRLGKDYATMESHLIRNFRKYAHGGSVQTDSIWNWLALAQHHGLPTRLLDWTYSPYVALHFATTEIECFHQDSHIWCVDYEKSNALLPSNLRRLLAEEGAFTFTVEMLERAARSLPEFDRLSSDVFVLFFEPPSLDERIVNQFALFSLMSSAQTDMEHWLRQHPDLYTRIQIPASLKREIRDKLDQANITERVLFPGLDGLSAWLRRYYTTSL